MSKGARIARKVLLGFISFICVIIILLTGLYFYIPNLLESKGISIKNLEYRFPGELSAESTIISLPDLSGDIESISLRWSWNELLMGKLNGSYLMVHGASIIQTAKDPTATDSSSLILPDFYLDRIILNDCKFQLHSLSDTLEFTIQNSMITGLKYEDAVSIDSLIMIGNQVIFEKLNQSNLPNDAVENPSSSAIPDIIIRHLRLEDCAVAYEAESANRHHVSQLNVQMNQLDSKNLMKSTIEQLAFVYQDTLPVNAIFGTNEVEDNDEIVLNEFSIRLPGLELYIPAIEIKNQHNLAIDVTFGRSMIRSGLITRFYPDIRLPADEDLPIYFAGQLSYGEQKLILNQLMVEISDHVKLGGNIILGLGDPVSRFSGKQLAFSSTLFDVSSLLQIDLPPEQGDLSLKAELEINGFQDQFDAEGRINLDNQVINFSTVAQPAGSGKTSISLSLSSDSLEVQELSSSFPELNFAGLNLKINTILDSLYKPISLLGSLTCDSAQLSEFWFLDPKISFNISNNFAELGLSSLTNNITALIKAKGNIIKFSDLQYSGKLKLETPSPKNLAISTGMLCSSFKGMFQEDQNGLLVKADLDTIHFSPFGSEASFISRGYFSFHRDNLGIMSLTSFLDSANNLNFTFNDELLTWIQAGELRSNYPVFDLDLKLNVDSILMHHVADESIYLDLPELKLKAQEDGMTGSLKLDHFHAKGFQISNLGANLASSGALIEGRLDIASFQSEAIVVDSVDVIINVDEKNLTNMLLSAYLPAVENKVVVEADMAALDSGYLFRLSEQHGLQFGDQSWDVEKNRGVFIGENADIKYADLKISNGNQSISLGSRSEEIMLSVASLQLAPLVQVFADSTTLSGAIDLDLAYDLSSEDLHWQGSIRDIALDSMGLGIFNTSGSFHNDELLAEALLKSSWAKFALDIKKEGAPLEYHLNIESLDLAAINQLMGPTDENEVLFEGGVHGTLKGRYDESLQTNGFVSLQDAQVTVPNVGFKANIQHDTIYFNDNIIDFEELRIQDENGDELIVAGNIELGTDPTIDLNLLTNQFAMINQEKETDDVWGKVQIMTDLSMKGPLFSQLNIDGNLRTLPNSSLNYKYKSSVSLDEREEVVNFISFNETEPEPRLVQREGVALPIDWNVDIEIGRTELYILIFESSRDYARLLANGELRLRSASDGQLRVFGDIASTNGSIFYDAPMISDLNLKILNAAARWNGDPEKPLISFQGSQVFRVSPKEFPGLNSSSNAKTAVSVKAIIDESTLETFNLRFDLTSGNGQIGTHLQSLPRETREQYAINLLVFGTIESDGGSGGNSAMQSLVSKLNEISRRNVKNADLSFYVDSNTADETSTESLDRFGYSFSKGFFERKVRISVGGNINFSDDAPQGSKKFNPLGNIRLDYMVSENPEITLSAMKSDVYRGVIDGQVNESSLGFTYQKTFRNFFQIFGKKKGR